MTNIHYPASYNRTQKEGERESGKKKEKNIFMCFG
jgi:hypothetical protein